MINPPRSDGGPKTLMAARKSPKTKERPYRTHAPGWRPSCRESPPNRYRPRTGSREKRKTADAPHSSGWGRYPHMFNHFHPKCRHYTWIRRTRAPLCSAIRRKLPL